MENKVVKLFMQKILNLLTYNLISEAGPPLWPSCSSTQYTLTWPQLLSAQISLCSRGCEGGWQVTADSCDVTSAGVICSGSDVCSCTCVNTDTNDNYDIATTVRQQWTMIRTTKNIYKVA